MLYYKRLWHIYFRISVGLVIICSSIISLNAGFVAFFFVHYDLDIGSNNLTDGRVIYNMLRSFQPSTNDSYRYSMWVLCGERLFATVKFKNYQDYKKKYFGLISSLFIVGATLITKYSVELLNISKYVNLIYTVMDLPLLFIIVILLILNCRKKKNALHDGTDLSSKFQLNENYFLIIFSIPIITFNVLQLFIINIIAIKVNDFKMNHNQLFAIVYTFRIIAYILFQIYIFFNKYILTLIKKRFEKNVVPIEVRNCKTTCSVSKTDDSQQRRADVEKNIYFKMLEKDLSKKK
uniref:G-protein coupled receptors family 1 profile domain-containing protein n=1 Tax=Strongyloides venezuelensis TaxID=75913 RepID=A0A0K0FW41_STRVS